MSRLGFTLLSTVGITVAGTPVPLTASKVRTVLAALLLTGGRRVPTGQLIDQVWADEPPASAVKNVQLYVHRLRQRLDDAEPGASARLYRSADGYCLDARPGEVDLSAAEELAGQAEKAQAAQQFGVAAALLDQALDEWSDHPLGGVTPSFPLAAATQRLRQRRLDLLERRCRLDLALGRHAEAADRLGHLVLLHPLRETLHALLITALSRAGNRAEAIDVFHRLRARLDDELGIDPGHDVRAAYQELLGAAPPRPRHRGRAGLTRQPVPEGSG